MQSDLNGIKIHEITPVNPGQGGRLTMGTKVDDNSLLKPGITLECPVYGNKPQQSLSLSQSPMSSCRRSMLKIELVAYAHSSARVASITIKRRGELYVCLSILFLGH